MVLYLADICFWFGLGTFDKSIITAKSMMYTATTLATEKIYFKQIEKYLFKEFTYSCENGLSSRFTIGRKPLNGFGFGSGFGFGLA